MLTQRVRKTPRFKVHPSFPLKVSFPTSGAKLFELQTLGLGGFGFFGTQREARLLQGGRVSMHLQIAGRKIELDGQIPYCQFLPQKGGVNFIGVELNDLTSKHRLMLETIIESGLSKGHLIPLVDPKPETEQE